MIPGTRAGLLAAVLFSLLRADLAAAGAWTRDPGSFYLRVAASRYGADEEYDAQSDRQALPLGGDFRELDFSFYGEYGLTTRFTCIAAAPFKKLRKEDKVRIVQSSGIGDLDLALRAGLYAGRQGVVSSQVLLKVPSGYEVDVDLPLGNGELETDLRLQFGRSLWPVLPGYCGIEAGYRWRAGDPADELRYLAELGSDLGAGFYLRAKLDGLRGRRNQRGADSYGNPTIRGSADLGALDLAAGRRVTPSLSIEGQFTSALYGRTTTSGSLVALALAWTGGGQK